MIHQTVQICFILIGLVNADIDCDKHDKLAPFSMCCDEPNQALRDEIIQMVTPCQGVDDECNGFTCLTKKLEISDGKNGIDLVATKKFIKDKVSNDFSEVINKIIDPCYEKTNSSACSASAIANCISFEYLRTCPSTKLWNKRNSPDCDELKKYIEKCAKP